MDGRRSIRRSMVLPVMLSGTDFSGTAFQENTWTIGVNRHGAKISTAYKLAVGDQIVVGNPVLGQSARARVIRVAEKGRAFEIGVELLELNDVWGARVPAEHDEGGPDNGGGGQGSDSAARTQQAAQVDSSLKPAARASTTEANGPQPVNSPSRAASPNAGESGNPRHAQHFDSLASFLHASRDELDSLLARTQELQRLGAQAVQSLLQTVHATLHQELEAAATGFESETQRRLERQASAALESFGSEASARQTTLLEEGLARWRAAREEIELSLKQGTEEFEKKLASAAHLAVEDVQARGKGLFEGFRNDLQKTLDDSRTKGVEDVAEALRATAGELADELRRRADVGFEILNEQLTRSAKVVAEQVEQQIAELSRSALVGLARSASDAVAQQVELGVRALNEATDRSRLSLENHLQQSLADFERHLGQLTSAALEKNSKTSESLLHDLQSRLDQAARALQRSAEAAGLD